MKLYQAIFRRKSCRNYDLKPLSTEVLEKITLAIQNFEKLDNDIEINWRFAKRVKGMFRVVAPHYLIVGGPYQPRLKQNIGFLFEQLVLWFDTMEIGCVWLGASTDVEAENPEKDVIAIAFGSTIGPVHRTQEQFKRKPIEKITNNPTNGGVIAANLAPSGMNTQPWYFEQKNDAVYVYKQKLKIPLSMTYKLSDIDMGIALCHYALTCKEIGKQFIFTQTDMLPSKAGYLPFGIIK